jgi:hypothetical protein
MRRIHEAPVMIVSIFLAIVMRGNPYFKKVKKYPLDPGGCQAESWNEEPERGAERKAVGRLPTFKRNAIGKMCPER